MLNPRSLASYEAASSSIDRLYQIVCLHQDAICAPGLLRGHLGTALLHCMYARYSGRQTSLDMAHNRICKAVRQITDQSSENPSDFTELSLLAHYVNNTGMLRNGLDERISALDTLLLEKMRTAIRKGVIGGFSSGAIGYGLHFLNRASQLPAGCRKVMAEIVRGLRINAVHGPAACHWCYNQPYTHTLWNGQAAVILFLIRAVELGLIGKGSVSDMLLKAVNHLLHQHKHLVATELLSLQMGDLGIGYTLLRAGQMFENGPWQQTGMQILGARAGKMLATPACGLPLGILNGAAGAAVVFEKVYAMTANVLFNHAAECSYGSLLSARPAAGPDTSPAFSEHELSFGTGIAGIAAALIQMLSTDKGNLQQVLWLI